ncbi:MULTISPECIES: cysteine desulfurase [unclassified Aureimonas]|uniref:SufS family cysteine desulfurase n=1 Tax=Aureimonas sp. Leaf427 TaxID=1736375 RepID=UPI001FCCDC04|nr:cysteine desulfurase [Aureimonas sp. Leaf460]
MIVDLVREFFRDEPSAPSAASPASRAPLRLDRYEPSASPAVHSPPSASAPVQAGQARRAPPSNFEAPSLGFLTGGSPRETEGAALDAAPSSGVSPINLHHGRHDSSQDYYYLRGPKAAGVPAATTRSDIASVAPTPAFAPLPASPASVASQADPRPLTGGAPIPAGFDVHAVRRDFPALHQSVNGKPLVWLDNAATTHKPQSVIDATSEFYSRHNSNIHRAAHTLAARSTDLFEGARDKLRDFIGAASSKEIVFLRGTTEAINLVANSYGGANIGPGDEIVITHIEHHANIVPWQLLAQRTGAVLKVAPVDERGELRLDRFAALLGPRTKFVSVTHVANALGTVVPVEWIIQIAHAHGVPVLVDAAQSSPHIPIDVQALDADFLVLSGHKIFGPTGIGILYGKERHLDAMPPWQGGGHMIRDVTFEKTIYQGLPEKFEAGTPDIAGAVGLGAAVDYLGRIGLPAIAAYEHALLDYATERLGEVKGLKLIGTAPVKASVLSFVVDGFEPEQVSRHLDRHGIATRSGHHCAQPALRHFGVEQTVRASLAFYNTKEDVDTLIHGLERLPRH